MTDREAYQWAIRVEDHPEDWDLIEWRTPGCVYPLLIRRGGMGQLCGYVGVPPGHPFHGRNAGFPGVEHAGPCDEFRTPTGEPPTCWWFGFACRGYMPYSESFFQLVSKMAGAPPVPKVMSKPSNSYIGVSACRESVENLAAHLEHWGEQLRGVTTRDNGDGTVAMIDANGKEILQMPDDVWDGFTRLAQRSGLSRL